MTFSIKVIAAFALVILFGIGAISFETTRQDEDDRRLVIHTQLVIEKLQAVLIDVNQAETGQRGYVMTGQEEYLQPYVTSTNQVLEDITQLRELISDNPAQVESIERLEPLVTARLARLAAVLEIRRRSGLMPGIEAVSSSLTSGEELMSQVTVLLGEMQAREEDLLTARLLASTSGAKRTRVVIVLGNALAVAFLFSAGVVIHQQMIRGNLAEHEVRRANHDLVRRAAELFDANSELESFSYSVAHDLRAPLRQIAGYSSVLLQDHGAHLDAEGRRYLDKVGEGAAKMGRLVDALLSLSKIGRQELVLQATPLDSLLRQVVEDLAPECTGRDIEWQIGNLFEAECDPALVKQVFVNLLSNAIKYTRKREHAVIQVGTMSEYPRVLFVADNGAGFEMKYVGKLFGVFQRLHKARDFEGNGVGLAIVQRIVRKHGGRIWATAELDQGATFFFTLEAPLSGSKLGLEHFAEKETINV